VLRHIHVGKREVTFLGLPDGGLSILSSRAAGVLNRAIGRVSNCDLLVLPASDDDHPDHRAVATIARRSAKARRRYEYLVWPNRQAPCRSATHRLVLGPVAAAKRGAIRRYRSQTGAIIDDPGGFTITRSELAAFSHPVEQFRAVRP
jgi:LmbE family N-acetylglucosaminyl deacetylase